MKANCWISGIFLKAVTGSLLTSICCLVANAEEGYKIDEKLSPAQMSAFEEPSMGFTLEQSFRSFHEADLKTGATGDVATTDATSSLSYTKFRKKTFGTLSVDFNHRDYEWGGIQVADDVQSFGTGLNVGHQFSRSKWGIFGLVGVSVAGETEGGAIWDGRTINGGTGVSYRFGKNLLVGGGLIIVDQPERDTRFYPILFVDWQISPHWSLESRRGAAIVYDLEADGVTTFSLGMDYLSYSYRLARQALPDGSFEQPVLEDDALALELGVKHYVFDGVYAEGAFIGLVYREFELRHNESSYREFDADPTFGARIALGVQF